MNRIEVMEQAALEAGAFMRGSTETDSTDKSNSKDFVTVSDIKAQDMLRQTLNTAFSEAVILSEEDSETERDAMYEPNFTGFILDPIDGTYNFKRGMQESAISIGYIVEGQAEAGVIYDPFKNELYRTERGQGATCNGRPIHVSAQAELSGANVVFSNSYDDAAMARNLSRHMAIYEQTGTMPWTACPGSGVLILAWVACGRIDAYHHNGIKPWDNAAGLLLIEEAGGVVTSLSNEPVLFTTSQILVGTPKVHRALAETFSHIDPDLLR